MKKVYLGLTIAALLTGCANTADTTKSVAASVAPETTKTAVAIAAVATGENLIIDPQLTEFRSNSGKSDVWEKDADKKNGLGDAGSSKDSAFDYEGSSRLRFVAATDDFSAQPGLSQKVLGLKQNTDYQLSLYYSDKKGEMSPSQLVFGVNNIAGQSIVTKTVHVSELANAPQGALKKHFRQTVVNFNSGSNVAVTVYAKLQITDASKIALDGDIGKQTEVRIDEFKLAEK